MRISDEAIQPLYDALARWHVSPDVAANLQGLLTDDEMMKQVAEAKTVRKPGCFGR